MTDDDEIGLGETVAEDGQTRPSLPSMESVTALELIAARYEIQALLGTGGMGRVYRVHDRTLDEVVALKMLRREQLDLPGVLDRFRQEVKLARRVTSPHVVRTFDLGEHASDHFLTMELIDGKSLAHVLGDGPLALDDCLRIARAVCTGIAAAHAAQVLHRDLKPDNVLVAKTGRIVITDFGIACFGPTIEARFVGTPAYMAPEQVTGEAELGPPTDVYAFGAILYEMLTGRMPFTGTDAMTVAFARVTEPPPDPRASRAVPDSLAELVLRCLDRDPAARFGDGAALGAALARIADVHSTTPTVANPIVPTKSARSVALLPLRASPELAELAEGLGEEIVDALSMTRDLRVRPLASVRGVTGADPRAIGEALGVDVVVDASLRQLGGFVRITARVIGVVDGFQLWANRFDTQLEGLLATGDKIARSIATALTAELTGQPEVRIDARATELYLEAKGKLRREWYGVLGPVIDDLEQALLLAPGDPSILATLATALARSAFFSDGSELPRARELAERAIVLDPGSGESWLALGLAHLYRNETAEGAFALSRAVSRAPGLGLAQGMLGALLLEAGTLADATAHLEGAIAIDPRSDSIWDLARAYVYGGRTDHALAMLGAAAATPFRELLVGRYRAWRGEQYDSPVTTAADPRAELASLGKHAHMVFRSRTIDPDARAALLQTFARGTPRLRASLAQFACELFVFGGDNEHALLCLEQSVAAGLRDQVWFERCPMVERLRADPRFPPLAAIVRERASAIAASVRAGLRDA